MSSDVNWRGYKTLEPIWYIPFVQCYAFVSLSSEDSRDAAESRKRSYRLMTLTSWLRAVSPCMGSAHTEF